MNTNRKESGTEALKAFLYHSFIHSIVPFKMLLFHFRESHLNNKNEEKMTMAIATYNSSNNGNDVNTEKRKNCER